MGFSVYRKPTHTNRYLNAQSHHHPSQKQSVVNSLISRSFRLTEPETRGQELKQITAALQQNGYTNTDIKKAIKKQQNPKNTSKNNDEEPRQKAVLPYIKGITDKIGRVLRKNNITPIFKPQKTIANILGNPKDKIELENHGVYSIPCADCDQTYIGQTNRRISTRVQEHKNSLRNKQTTSALFQHHQATGHKIDFNRSREIASIENYRVRTIREALEIEKSGQLNKRDDALNIPATWKIILKDTKKHRTSQDAKTNIQKDNSSQEVRGRSLCSVPANQETTRANKTRTQAEANISCRRVTRRTAALENAK